MGTARMIPYSVLLICAQAGAPIVVARVLHQLLCCIMR